LLALATPSRALATARSHNNVRVELLCCAVLDPLVRQSLFTAWARMLSYTTGYSKQSARIGLLLTRGHLPPAQAGMLPSGCNSYRCCQYCQVVRGSVITNYSVAFRPCCVLYTADTSLLARVSPCAQLILLRNTHTTDSGHSDT
jgi:hypothetical protein